jgi:hypothetical protein
VCAESVQALFGEGPTEKDKCCTSSAAYSTRWGGERSDALSLPDKQESIVLAFPCVALQALLLPRWGSCEARNVLRSLRDLRGRQAIRRQGHPRSFLVSEHIKGESGRRWRIPAWARYRSGPTTAQVCAR